MKLQDKRELLESERAWPMSAVERARLEKKLEILYQLQRMDSHEDDPTTFARALLTYLYLKEGLER